LLQAPTVQRRIIDMSSPRETGLSRWEDRRVTLALVLGITAVALTLRCYGAVSSSLWRDELFSVYWARSSYGFLLSRGFWVETNPPLYYVLLKTWCVLFGSGEAAVRSLSVVVSTLTVPALYGLGSKLWGRRVGLVSAAALAISPLQIYYAHEARTYVLLPLLFVVVATSVAYVLEQSLPPRGRALALAGYALGSALLVYSHVTMVIPVGVLSLLTLWHLRHRSSLLAGFLAANVALALLVIPEALTAMSQMHSQNIAWIGKPGPGDVLAVIDEIAGGPITPKLYAQKLPPFIIATLLLLVALVPYRKSPPAARIILLCPLLAFAIALLAGLLRPIFIARIFVWISVPLCLAFGAAALHGATRYGRAALVLAFVALCLFGVVVDPPHEDHEREPWRTAVHTYAAELAAADLIVVGPVTTPLGFDYYGPHSLAPKLRRWITGQDVDGTAATLLFQRTLGLQEISSQDLAADIRRGERIVLVVSGDTTDLVAEATGFNPPPNTVAKAETSLVFLFWHGNDHH
jgi:4-amino-4-deoxy-L-arabinose transferase-like glycosyltransferase